MTDESTKHITHKDDNAPASKGDVRRSQDEIAVMMAESFATVATKDQMSAVESRLDGLEEGQQKLENSQQAILNVVESIDEQLKEWKKIPAKVERLHKRVFGSH